MPFEVIRNSGTWYNKTKDALGDARDADKGWCAKGYEARASQYEGAEPYRAGSLAGAQQRCEGGSPRNKWTRCIWRTEAAGKTEPKYRPPGPHRRRKGEKAPQMGTMGRGPCGKGQGGDDPRQASTYSNERARQGDLGNKETRGVTR